MFKFLKLWKAHRLIALHGAGIINSKEARKALGYPTRYA